MERNIVCGTGIGCDLSLYCSFRLDDCTCFLKETVFFRIIDLCRLFTASFATHFGLQASKLKIEKSSPLELTTVAD